MRYAQDYGRAYGNQVLALEIAELIALTCEQKEVRQKSDIEDKRN